MKDHINSVIVGVVAAVIAGIILYFLLPKANPESNNAKVKFESVRQLPTITSEAYEEIPDLKFEEDKLEYELAYKKGVAAINLGDYKEGVRQLEGILSYDLSDNIEASTYGNLGIAYKELGRIIDAIAMYEKACSLNSSLYCGLSEFNKARMYEQNSAYENAIKSYKKVIDLEPSNITTKLLTGYKNINFQSCYYLGNILSVKYKDYFQAVSYYKKSLVTYDEEALGENDWRLEALNNLAYCYFELGDFENVILASRQILSINEYDKDALMVTASAYGNLGNDIEAEKYLRLAAKSGNLQAREILDQINERDQ